jgi:uncharacterized membrane protein YeaQ/YmgE (transglycosylase-associated protein family)
MARRKIRAWDGLGLVGDIVVGVAGSFLGHLLLPQAGVNLGSGVGAAIGAGALLYLVRLIRRL